MRGKPFISLFLFCFLAMGLNSLCRLYCASGLHHNHGPSISAPGNDAACEHERKNRIHPVSHQNHAASWESAPSKPQAVPERVIKCGCAGEDSFVSADGLIASAQEILIPFDSPLMTLENETAPILSADVSPPDGPPRII